MTPLEQRCLDHGLPMSRQRRLIIRVLSEARDHVSAADLYERVTALDPAISLATIYRTLTIFEASGVLRRLDFGDGAMRYEEAAKAPHDHLIDLTDGEVVEFQAPEIATLLSEISARLGYRLDGYRLDVYGRAASRPAGPDTGVMAGKAPSMPAPQGADDAQPSAPQAP